MPRTCDIFCNVVDNYGDIGVCWRLARQLAHEHGLHVRLWVDDLASFARLCPEADAELAAQQRRGVEVRKWTSDTFSPTLSPSPVIPPSPSGRGHGVRGGRGWPSGRERVADLVIEAFSCKLPENYLTAMAAAAREPVWVNLEYLSAEAWVEGCHKLPSPHPSLPLTRYFFFPGFTEKTGGLLLERDLLTRRDAFLSDAAQRHVWWDSLGLEMPGADTLKVSLFGYENAALDGLFDTWATGAQPVLCLVPEGRILPQVEQYFSDVGRASAQRRDFPVGLKPNLHCGNLRVCVLPFVEQERYDELLWACDVNFVRGEDSCVRAQWAGKPFVWQIYPQHDDVHWDKLQAFLNLYGAALEPDAAQALHDLWRGWNDGGGAGKAWPAFAAARAALELGAQGWARELAENNLALNLLDFSTEIGRMRAFKIEGSKS